jgi:hypothetical protein
MATETQLEKEIEFIKEASECYVIAAAGDAAKLQLAIAEAAYYVAERRGFAPGHELSDLKEAERQVRGRMDRMLASE